MNKECTALAAEIDAREDAVCEGTAALDTEMLSLLLFKYATSLVYAHNRGELKDLFDVYGFKRRTHAMVSDREQRPVISAGARVLVIDLRMIGDTVNAGELCAALTRRLGAVVSFVGSNGNSAVLAPCALAARYDLYTARLTEQSGKDVFLTDTGALLEALRQARFDLVINLNKTPLAMLLAFAAGAPVYGWTFDDRLRSVFCGTAAHRTLGEDTSVHLVEAMLSTVFEAAPARADEPLFFPDVQSGVPPGCAGIFIGARFSARRWYPAQWAQVAVHIKDAYGLPCVIFGGKQDRALAREIMRQSEGVCTDFCGQIALERLGGALANCRLLITNDSGGKHVAAAGDVPCIEISGAGLPLEMCGPYAAGSLVVQAEVDCRNCNMPYCERAHECMTSISAKPVCALIDAVLSGDDEAALRARCAAGIFDGLRIVYSGTGRPDIGHRYRYVRGGA